MARVCAGQSDGGRELIEEHGRLRVAVLHRRATLILAAPALRVRRLLRLPVEREHAAGIDPLLGLLSGPRLEGL